MPRFAAAIDSLFAELPFLERIAAAAEAGFGAVELADPYGHPPEEIAAALAEARMEVAMIATPPGDVAAGERGLASLPGRVPDFEAGVRRALDYAAHLRPWHVHVLAGVSRGPWARSIYVANLRRACEMARGQSFTIEPMNLRDAPGYHLVETADARTVMDAVGVRNLGLQLNLYHCQIAEGDVTRRIEALAPVLRHVRIAGVPEGAEPDRGELALDHVLGVLERVGYRGWIGCAYRPAGRTEDGLGWLARRRAVTPATAG
jgi:hydroxypyruvate isomerase